jgi:hypothetical protein
VFADFGSRLYGPIDAYVPARRLGSHFVKEVRTPTFVNQYVVNQRHTHPGNAGGRNAAPDHCVVGSEVVDPAVSGVRLNPGEQLVYDFPLCQPELRRPPPDK